MVSFFRILWADDLDERFVGDHPYELPRFKCPNCGSDHEASVSFPWVEGTKVFDSKTLRLMAPGKDPKGYGLESYRAHAAALQKVVGKQYLVPPGAYFGKFVGKVRRLPQDFDHAMMHYHMLFAKRSVFRELNKLGFGLQAFDLELKKKEDSEKYVEIWAPPVGSVANAKFCTECNRSSNNSRVLKADGVPKETHLFCCGNNPNFLVVSGALVDAITRLGFKGITFAELSME